MINNTRSKQKSTTTTTTTLKLGSILLLENAYKGNIKSVEALLEIGVSLDTADSVTGMTALHLAVGCNHLELTRFLVERGASFVPDKQGRMPTTIAVECEVSDELCDFIVEAEAAAEARAEGV
jgi:ankyrin repeat protein